MLDAQGNEYPYLDGQLPSVAHVLLRDVKRFRTQLAIDADVEVDVDAVIRDVERKLAQGRSDTGVSERQALNQLVQLCVQGRLQLLLAAHSVPHPTYNYFEDFGENASGPWDVPPRSQRPASAPVWRVLGFEVGFPIGIPASVLTSTSEWIAYYAQRDFNILTFKTVRSIDKPAHDPPNWVFLQDATTSYAPGSVPQLFIGEKGLWPEDPLAFSMANSFGVPSSAPQVWQREVTSALARLRSDQLLIVSVMGSYEVHRGPELVSDFVRVAQLAEDTGVRAIELNLSCPNGVDPDTGAVKGVICESVDDTVRIVEAVREQLRPDTRLVVKLSYMDHENLERLLSELCSREHLIHGVSGINTVQADVITKSKAPSFPGRDRAGISGIAIRALALEFVRSLQDIRARNKWRYEILGMGGVMSADDVFALHAVGAAAVQTATAAFFNPALAEEVQYRFGGTPMAEQEIEARSVVLELLLSEGRPMGLQEIAKNLTDVYKPTQFVAQRAWIVLRSLENEHRVRAAREEGQIVYSPQ